MFIKAYGIIGPTIPGMAEDTFSAEKVRDILTQNPNEKVLIFGINSPGGDCDEAFAIYDLLRSSGREIHCHIEGGCHSAATIILLAAPKKNRTAGPNARGVIHDVRTEAGEVTADSAVALSESLLSYRNQLLDIYADRTGTDRAHLESIMLEEKARTAQELLDLGFISKITQYTNFKNQNMNKPKSLRELGMAIANFFREQIQNYAFLDADGNTLFETEKEDESLAVGDPATPDGTFELPDGRTVTVADGVVTDIKDPASTEDMQAQIANLTERLATAENLLREAQGTISNLAATRSVYNVRTPINQPGKPASGVMTSADRKAAVKANLKGGKK